jgi:hypothetical protein
MSTPNSGYWKKLEISNLAGDGTLVAAPGANRRVVLVAVTCTVGTAIKETNTSGDVIIHVGTGMNRFPSPIYVTSNTAVFAEDVHGTAGNISAFYYIEAMDTV